MKGLPFSFIVSAVGWDVFGTLTYREECRSLEQATVHGLAFLEKIRIRCRLQERDYYWFLRPERGERNGRVHLHVLMKIKPECRGEFLVMPGYLPHAHKVWGRGMTTFRAVSGAGDPAVLYLQKSKDNRSDSYESCKTAACSSGVPSLALLRRASLQKSEGEPDGRGTV